MTSRVPALCMSAPPLTISRCRRDLAYESCQSFRQTVAPVKQGKAYATHNGGVRDDSATEKGTFRYLRNVGELQGAAFQPELAREQLVGMLTRGVVEYHRGDHHLVRLGGCNQGFNALA